MELLPDGGMVVAVKSAGKLKRITKGVTEREGERMPIKIDLADICFECGNNDLDIDCTEVTDFCQVTVAKYARVHCTKADVCKKLDEEDQE